VYGVPNGSFLVLIIVEDFLYCHPRFTGRLILWKRYFHPEISKALSKPLVLNAEPTGNEWLADVVRVLQRQRPCFLDQRPDPGSGVLARGAIDELGHVTMSQLLSCGNLFEGPCARVRVSGCAAWRRATEFSPTICKGPPARYSTGALSAPHSLLSLAEMLLPCSDSHAVGIHFVAEIGGCSLPDLRAAVEITIIVLAGTNNLARPGDPRGNCYVRLTVRSRHRR